jgi:hypothetical protein
VAWSWIGGAGVVVAWRPSGLVGLAPWLDTGVFLRKIQQMLASIDKQGKYFTSARLSRRIKHEFSESFGTGKGPLPSIIPVCMQ